MAEHFENNRDHFSAVRALLREMLDWLRESDSSRVDEVVELCSELDERLFKVAVVATTSSGKSTFVNALLGLDLMPVGDEAKTALPVRIRPVRLAEQPRMIVEYRDGRDGEVFEIDLGDTEPTRKQLDQLMAAERAPLVARVLIHAPMTAFRAFTGQDLPEVEIIDTPGPTTRGLRDHRERALLAIEEAHAVIYLLDFKKPFQSSDAEILEQVRRIWEDRGQLARAASKMFFALNRVDDRGERNQRTPRDRAKSDSGECRELLGVSALRATVPVSAKAAMYARLAVRGPLRDHRDRYAYDRLLRDLRFWAEEDGEDELLGVSDSDDFLLQASGMLPLEESVYRFLVESSLRELAADALDSAISILEQDHRNVRRQIALWDQRGEEILVRLGQARRALDEFRGRFRDEHEGWASQTRTRASEAVAKAVSEFRMQALGAIDDAQQESIKVGGAWKALRKDLSDVWNRLNQEKVEEFASQEAARERQMELAAEVAKAISPYQARFLVDLGSDLRSIRENQNRRHRVTVESLAREVEIALGRELGSAAAFPDERLDLPPAPPLDDLELGDIGISSTKVKRRRKKTEKVRPWYFLWLVEVERKRTVTVKESVYSISLAEVFAGVRESYATTLESWRESTVDGFSEGFIDQALKHYQVAAERYIQAIESSLQQHEADRREHADQAEVIADLRAWEERCRGYMARAGTIRTHAN